MRPGRGWNRSSATANVTLYCTWRSSGLTIGLHGQGVVLWYGNLNVRHETSQKLSEVSSSSIFATDRWRHPLYALLELNLFLNKPLLHSFVFSGLL